MKRTPEIRLFIRENAALFWHIPKDKKDDVSDALLVETILNYGDLENVKKLFSLLDIQKVAAIFRENVQNKRCNYLPAVKHFFTPYFNRHV